MATISGKIGAGTPVMQKAGTGYTAVSADGPPNAAPSGTPIMQKTAAGWTVVSAH